MISTCRTVLSSLRKLSSNSECTLSFLGNTHQFCLASDKSKIYDPAKYKGEINGIISQLVSDGYLEYSYSNLSFHLTQRGLHPYRFQWEAVKFFLFRSILVPIIVSFATSALTLLAKALL